MLEKIKKNKFVIGVIVVSLIYLILVSVQPPNCSYYAGADDYLILHEAKSILDFKWLGHFWGRTLSKGPGAQIFIVIANLVGLTFLQAHFLLYIGAAVLFIHVLKKVIKNDWIRLLIFTVILFNPLIYSTDLVRVYRDGVYSSFLLYTVSCVFGIFFNYKEDIKKILPYMFGFGIFATWMAITREETIWIAPFVIGSAFITSLFIIFDKKCQNKLKRILLYLIPICIYLVTIFVICFLNKIVYGQFVRTEQNTKAYKNFIKTASSVDVEVPILKADISTEAREKIYKVSPSFAELKEDLESSYKTYGDLPDEIENGWFMWAVFEAIDHKGYSNDLNSLNSYLEKVTDEINEAFEDGRLKKEDDSISIFDKENLKLLFENLRKAFKFQVSMENIQIKNEIDEFSDEEHPEILSERKAEFYEIIGQSTTNSLTYNYKTDEIKINVLTKISKIYEALSKPLFYIGLVIYCLMILRFLFIKPRFGNYKELIVLTSFIILYFIRLVVIAYVHTKMCDAITPLYLSSTYSLQFAFEILALIFGITGVINFVKILKRKN